MAHQPPELVQAKATPRELARRLAILREDFRHGGMTAGDFNKMLSVFQFTDEAGYIWAPGARTSQWYRWDGRAWQAADPPPHLYVPNDPLTESPQWEFANVADDEEDAASAAAGERRCQCGALLADDETFCTECGTPYRQPAPAATCPVCGKPVKEGVRFCGSCGKPLGGVPEAPRPIPAAPPVEQSRLCASCGAPLKPNKKFCTVCGTAVGGA